MELVLCMAHPIPIHHKSCMHICMVVERNGVCRHALDINIDGWIEYNGNTMQIKWRAPPFAENDNVNSIIPKPYLSAVVQQT